MSPGRWALLALLALGLALFLGLDLHHRLAPAELARHQSALAGWVALHPMAAAATFLVACVLMAGLSLPGSLVLPVLGGALFGPLQAVVLSAAGLSAGAVLSFLSARYLLRAVLLRRWGHRLARIDAGLAGKGAFLYLLSLRMIPVLPFFLLNLLLGLTGVGLRAFHLSTLIGMLPAMAVLAGVGDGLARLESVSDALSPRTLLTLFGLAIGLALLRHGRPMIDRLLRARDHGRGSRGGRA